MMASLLRRLLGVLSSRHLWTCLSFVVMAALISLLGPLVAIGDTRPLASTNARLWAIVFLVVFLLLRMVWRRWLRSASHADIRSRLRAMMQSDSIGNETEEIKQLRLCFADALKLLRYTRFGTRAATFKSWFVGRRYLYELPWYLIIGASGAGKTTVLHNAGLKFPLEKSLDLELPPEATDPEKIKSTKNCDWWFGNQAVVIDPAGRYITQDNDAENDRNQWRSFTELLRKSRSLQPINGVLLTLSVTELLDYTREDRFSLIKKLRHRLDELSENIGIPVPVYLLINKCDLLSGFSDYFSSLDHVQREQVWGFTLPWAAADTTKAAEVNKNSKSPSDLADRIGSELSLLCQRLDDGLADAMLSEPELTRRARMYSFTQQFALLCEVVQEIAALLFADSRFTTAPLLRGIYFTSATQVGMPLDRVGCGLEQAQTASGSEMSRAYAKSYFLSNLLDKVVFAEAYLSGPRCSRDRRARLQCFAGYAASVLLLTVVGGAWIKSYHHNERYLTEVDAKAKHLADSLSTLATTIEGNVYPLLAPLTETQDVPNSVYFKVTEPLLSWTFGLYQGDKLWAATRPIYENILQNWLAPTIEAHLEWLLRTVAAEDLEFSYEILKAYLMLHDRSHFNGEVFKEFILADWDYNLPTGAAQQEHDALAHHIQTLIDMGAMRASRPIDTALVEATRARLTQVSFARRVYRRLLRVLEPHNLPDFFIDAAVGPGAPVVFRRISGQPLSHGVSALYTYRGYHELFAPRVDQVLRYVGRDDAWVLGRPIVSTHAQIQAIASGEMALEVKKLYMRDYVSAWERFIDDIDLIKPNSLAQATDLARELSALDSPLIRLIRALVNETTLLTPPYDSGESIDISLLERGKRSLQATQNDVAHLIGSSALPVRIREEEKPELIVDTRFAALRRSVVLGASGEDAGPWTVVLRDLTELHLLLNAVAEAHAGGYLPPNSDLPARLKAQASRLSAPGKRLLETLADASSAMVMRQTRAVQSVKMAGAVTRTCRETIAGRYPFDAGATREVTSEDFARMFGPGGIADSYFQRELAPLVDVSVSPWRWLSRTHGAIGNSTVPAQFERAAIIKDVFFRSGDGPALTLLIKPIEMDASITRMQIDIDGQLVRYQHGPQVSHTVHWPGRHGSHQIRLSLEPALGDGNDSLLLEGTWALHRLFDKARIVPGNSPERFQVILQLGGREVRLEVVTGSVKNAFALTEMRKFSCPAGL